MASETRKVVCAPKQWTKIADGTVYNFHYINVSNLNGGYYVYQSSTAPNGTPDQGTAALFIPKGFSWGQGNHYFDKMDGVWICPEGDHENLVVVLSWLDPCWPTP